jgi:hydrogenase/urease accessory protein HupE
MLGAARLVGLARLVAFCLALAAGTAGADVFRPAYLELRQRDAETWDVLWKVPSRGEDLRLALYVRLPEGTENLTEPLGIFTGGAYVERWSVRRAGGLTGQTIEIEGLSGGVSDVIARVERSDGSSQVARLLPAAPRFTIEAPAGDAQVARTYLVLGIEHILTGFDHLLFVAALLLVVRSVRRAALTVTAFTVAHSLTLAAATLGFVHVPQPPVEAAIALSIVFVAAEIVHAAQGRPGLGARAPWLLAFGFGLLHGFGFAGALAEIGLPQRAIPLALLCFNVGVELGQLAFLAALIPLVWLAQRARGPWPRATELIPAYAIGTVAAFWVIERVAAFAR